MAQPTIDQLVVEVLSRRRDGARSRWKVGSGFMIGPSRILTAAHVVTGEETLVRLPGREEHPAVIATLPGSTIPAADAELDLAIVELTDRGLPAPQASFGRVVRTPTAYTPNITGCRAIGFPRFREQLREPGRPPVRDTARVDGYVPVGQGLVSTRLTLEVESSPLPLPEGRFAQSEWDGFSGAAVFVRQYLIGVVVEHSRSEGPSALAVIPISALDGHPEGASWYQALGVVDPGALPELPEGRASWEHDEDLGPALQKEFDLSSAGSERLLGQLATAGANVGFLNRYFQNRRVERFLSSYDELKSAASGGNRLRDRGAVVESLQTILQETRGIADAPARGGVRAACHTGLYAAAVLDGEFQEAGTQILLVFYSSPEFAMKVFPEVTEHGLKPKWRDIDRQCEAEAEAIRSHDYAVQRAAYAGAAVGLSIVTLFARTASGVGAIANAATNVSKDGIQGNKLDELKRKCEQRRMERISQVSAAALGLEPS